MSLDEFSSIALYLAVFLTAIVCAYVGQKKNSKTLCILAIILPALLLSFRYDTGTDSLTYRKFYDEIRTESLERTQLRLTTGTMEPFILLVSVIGKTFSLPASFLLMIFAIITTGFLYLATRRVSNHKAWVLYGMLLFIVLPEGFNMMRQLAAISAQAYALSYIISNQRDGKKSSFALVSLLAIFSISLHYSSAVLLPVLILPYCLKRIRGRSLAVIFGAIAAICIFAFPIVLDAISSVGILSEKHLETLLDSEGSIINIKFFSAAILAMVLFANYYRRKNSYDKQYGFLMLLGVIYSAIGFYSGYLGRLAAFFWVFIVLIIGEMICELFVKNHHRVAVCGTVAIGYFLLYFCVLGFDAILPYSFML